MLKRVKNFFARERGLSQAQMATLGQLPPDDRLAELGIILHDLCVKNAARFVEEEHQRADSPFRDLPESDLFHEMLVMSFWVFEWLSKGKHQGLMDLVHRQYSTSFVWGRESSHEELTNSMREKFRTYDEAWDDYSGHQDVFARQAVGIIFGGRRVAPSSQAAFWLISHADRTMKGFAEVKRSVDRLLEDIAPFSGKDP